MYKADSKNESNNLNTNPKWTKEEDVLLYNLVNNIGGKWKFISKYFFNKAIFQIYNRYLKINPNVKKGKFTLEEDKQILELINIYGTNWTKLANFVKNRCAKQIRSRYINVLSKNYDDSSEITEEEKKLIFSFFPILGNKWKKYSRFLGIKRSPAFIRKILYKN